ncbi:hypothetical protein L838_1608 [Mycobacterium avium MAV_120709_2344]|nr:hypothetical protein L838_1608 [Mycobacterium avium MAV_120709_2344]
MAAVNAAKTHCDNGHQFTEANTYVHTDRCGHTRRMCRACNRFHSAEYHHNRRKT